jgi:hypothetical protein
MSIFDNDGRGFFWVKSGDGHSQQTLNCALSVDYFFEHKDLDRTNPRKGIGFDSHADNESQIFKLSVSRLTGNAESFLTESLILAQNERWRRG